MKWGIENLNPASIAWIATMVMLLVYLIYNAFNKNDLGGTTGVIFFTALLIYGISELIYRKPKVK